MDWNKPWDEEKPDDAAVSAEEDDNNGEKKKWTYIFIESLKLAVLLPLIILAVEMFLLDAWPDVREHPEQLLFDYLFLFSAIFIIFVGFHFVQWRRRSRKHRR